MKKSAFTLAETLIVIAIIGIIASIVTPMLFGSTNDAEYKAAYKKAYADASIAWMQVVTDRDLIGITSVTGSMTSAESNFINFANKFNVIKTCNINTGDSSLSECWDSSGGDIYEGFLYDGVHEHGGAPTSDWPGFIDNAGRSWALMHPAFVANDGIFLDTNGLKKPNKYGKDRFFLQTVTKNCNIGDYSVLGFADDSSCVIGDQIKILPQPDFNTVINTAYSRCMSPPCYNTSWITNR
ncbi:MAG: prepilin-type N-terminal cleavage/methylation domain-containing protein [Candidatus Gastranaerophilales bacterium]|nr:prepilin-type N-terminal cleavage/methylation domain-containing protein [Candidatus Gastranaerophilales bacterium]